MFLFEVFNTSHRPLLVLAKDRDLALNIAWTAEHIRHTDTGLTSEGRDAHQMKPATYHQFERQLEAAVAQRLPGTVRVDGEDVFVGHTKVQS